MLLRPKYLSNGNACIDYKNGVVILTVIDKASGHEYTVDMYGIDRKTFKNGDWQTLFEKVKEWQIWKNNKALDFTDICINSCPMLSSQFIKTSINHPTNSSTSTLYFLSVLCKK